MRKRASIVETRRLVEKAIAKGQGVVDCLAGEENPQLVEMCIGAKATVDTLEIVLDALYGSTARLRIMGEKP